MTMMLFTLNLQAHCEVPCGIYNDNLRIELILEHTKTIEKSIKQIVKLEKGESLNQAVRWINTKEEHANKIQHIVTQYFMTQRIKPTNKHYQKQLTLLHKILIQSMKTKQTTDLKHVQKIRTLVTSFQKVYPHKH